jgi:Ca-activated chloride channel homolog
MRKLLLRLPQLVTILSVVAIFIILPADFSSLAQQHVTEGSQDAGAIRLGTELVSVRVTVMDQRGRKIEGLSKEDFRIYEDKIEQPVSFFSDEDTPASVGVVFDTSSSMSGAKILRAKEALARFIQTSHQQDEYFLVSFNSSPHLLLDSARDGQVILDQFNNVYPKGETALFDAVDLAIEKVSHGTYPKRALILISDGEDNHSRLSFNQLRQRLQEADVLVYSIGIGGNYPTPKSRATANGPILMDKLASISGGKSFWPTTAERMDEAFERIALELRRQYSIGYLPSNFVADGKWHRIKVTLTTPHELPRLVVRSREGYYAVKNSDDRHGNAGTGH